MQFILCLPRRGDAFAALDHCKGRGREAALFAQQCYFGGGAAHVTAALRRLPHFSAECVRRAGPTTDLNDECIMGMLSAGTDGASPVTLRLLALW